MNNQLKPYSAHKPSGILLLGEVVSLNVGNPATVDPKRSSSGVAVPRYDRKAES